jgi:DNA replication protein DnaC
MESGILEPIYDLDEASKWISRPPSDELRKRLKMDIQKKNFGFRYEESCIDLFSMERENADNLANFFNCMCAFVFITGGYGSGKTYLAAAILGSIFDKMVDFKVISEKNIVKQAYDLREMCYFQELFDQDLLIIEDMGIEDEKLDSMKNLFWYNLLKFRTENQMTTIITSRLKPIEIIDQYGASIFNLMFNSSKMMNNIIDLHHVQSRRTGTFTKKKYD